MDASKRRGRPRAHDREQVLLAAKTVAVQRGFDNVRFSDVAAVTGVPVSSLQYVFGSRDAMVSEVLRAGVSDELARLRQVIDQEPDPWRRIELFVERSISVDDTARREGWLLWIEYWRAALRDPALAEEYAEIADSWRSLVQGAVDDGVKGGAFDIAGTSPDAAASIVALVDGLGVQVEVGERRMRAGRAIRAAHASARRILGVT